MTQWWFVFTVSPGKEKAARQRLEECGYAALVPLLPWKTRKGPEKRKAQRLPAIPRFVFVLLGEDWRAIRHVQSCEFVSSRGRRTGEKCVTGAWRFAGDIAKVTKAEMEAFMAFLSAFREPSKQSVKAGDKVRVTYGPFEDKTGEVLINVGETLKVLVGQLVVRVKADAVELAAGPEKKDASGGIQLKKGANHTTTFRRDGGRSAAGGKSRFNPDVPRARTG